MFYRSDDTTNSVKGLKVHSHSYEYESGYLYTGSSKHEFACI